jgi:hypothetical protein
VRAVWIDLGEPVDVARLERLGVTRTYGDARNPSFAGGFERGIYRAQSWDNAAPVELARELSGDVKRWGGDPYQQLAVHANIELHDPAYLLAFLAAWRSRRPLRETAIVLEGNQAGWFTPELVRRIAGDPNLSIMAEAYTGSMGPLDADEVRSNLTNYGVPAARAQVMYDAARLHTFWDGCAFTQQRLPS